MRKAKPEATGAGWYWLFAVTPGSRSGSRVRFRAKTPSFGRNSARPFRTSPGSGHWKETIRRAPGSDLEPNGSLHPLLDCSSTDRMGVDPPLFKEGSKPEQGIPEPVHSITP